MGPRNSGPRLGTRVQRAGAEKAAKAARAKATRRRRKYWISALVLGHMRFLVRDVCGLSPMLFHFHDSVPHECIVPFGLQAEVCLWQAMVGFT